MSEILLNLGVSIFLSSLLLIGFGFAYLVYRHPLELHSFFEVVLHLGTFIWAAQFGSRIRKEAS
jgi:hypothetical protein